MALHELVTSIVLPGFFVGVGLRDGAGVTDEVGWTVTSGGITDGVTEGVTLGVMLGVIPPGIVGVTDTVTMAVGTGHSPRESKPEFTCAIWPLMSP